MNENDKLFERRQAVVSQGVGIFNRATVRSAHGAVLIDAEGNELIDFSCGIGVTSAGHCPEPVVEAICEQARKFLHTCFHVTTYEPYLQLCEKLAALLPHGEKTKVMLTNCGAESVENAVKIARQATGRKAIVAYTEAFHGRTLMAMSLTSKIDYKINCGPFAPEVYRLRFPNYYYYGDGLSYQAFVTRELAALRDFFKNTVPAQEIAAIIIEPVQGEGGFNVAPFEYLRSLRKLCDENGILLICDEVQSGFCRTGRWASYEHAGITPDISTWAKAMGGGLPIGAVVGRAEVMDAARPGTLGGTYLGNPVACAAALANIRYMEENNLNAAAGRIGAKITAFFKALQEKCPLIGDVRGLGAMVACELVYDNDPRKPATDVCNALITACLRRGLLLLSAGMYKNVLRVLAPLTIDDALLSQGLQIIEEELLKRVN